MDDRIRVGAVSYLNTRPLVFGFEQGMGGGRIDLSYDVPSRLAERAAAGALDVALLPVIELARIPDLEIVPGLSISSLGAARSVLLVSRRPLTRVERIALDPESRTSNALARVLLASIPGPTRRFQVGPRCIDAALRDHEAVVRIGDKALFEPLPEGASALDLGGAWMALAGLPFVFAVWAARPGIVDEPLYRLFHASKREGMKAIGPIAEDYTWNGHRYPDRSSSYLRENMRYRLGNAELAAMRRFLTLAVGAGAIESVPELRLVSWRRSACHDLAPGAAS